MVSNPTSGSAQDLEAGCSVLGTLFNAVINQLVVVYTIETAT